MEPLSDEDLVAKYRTSPGSPEASAALNDLFHRHHRRVALWCLRLTGDRESAADLAQEVFVKALRYLDSYRGQAKFSTWLYSITRNHCFTEIKSRALAPQQAGDPMLLGLTDQTPSIDNRLEQESSAQQLRDLIQRCLNPTELKAMTLHYVEGVPLDAVTRLLKLENASGAKAYIVSAMRKLRGQRART